ncbi:internal scaffolding protein [Blackfly microvirus SF02]|uniref:Internal scaffolding protein n=1 Tax=Blackfly microvirus SF02 TaxID=2576452 RepID=A0A4P8PKG9_9VIRU|nr:internal scaffolding protein [Blackfly microvirus SF02]
MGRYQGVNSNGEALSSMFVLRDVESGDPTITMPGGPSLTRQDYADECDINQIMAKYEVSGVVPTHLNPGEPRYLDVTDVPDLVQAMEILDQAQTAFMTLTAKVRREFDNDPAKFVEFAQDPANVEQMRTWGLTAPEKPADKPIVVEVYTPPPVPEPEPKAPRKG